MHSEIYLAIELELQADEEHILEHQLIHHPQQEQVDLPCLEKYHISTLQHLIDEQFYNKQHE